MKDEDKTKIEELFEKIKELIQTIEKGIKEIEDYRKLPNEYWQLLVSAKDKLEEAKSKHANHDEKDFLSIYLLLFKSGRLIYFLKKLTEGQVKIYR